MNWLIRLIFTTFLLHLLLAVLMISVGNQSAAGGVVAYTRTDNDYNPHVMLIDVQQGQTLELTPPEFEGRAPHWTPDGNRVTFPTVRNRNERHILEIYLDEYHMRNLTALWGYESVPIYSPIDSRIAFPLQPNVGNMPLMVVDSAHPDIEPEILLPSVRQGVAWSPDGQYLAYLMLPTPDAGEISSGVDFQLPNLFTTHLGTGESTNWLANTPSLGLPLWSPDSTRIAIPLLIQTGNNVQIINIATGEITQLATPPAGAQNLVWSPDGRYMAYTSRMNGNSEIFVTEIATGEYRNLSQSPSYDLNATWSADSNRLAYISHRNGQDDIYIVNIQSVTTYRLTYTSDSESEVVWRP